MVPLSTSHCSSIDIGGNPGLTGALPSNIGALSLLQYVSTVVSCAPQNLQCHRLTVSSPYLLV